MATRTSWRRALTGVAASGVLVAGVLIGAGTANADVLDDINTQYGIGAGGGQISNLVRSAMKLRALGFAPSKGNIADLEDGLAKRPNQGPLVSALESTVSYMKRNQMHSNQSGPLLNPPTIGINQNQPGQTPNPNYGPGINIPLG